MYAMMQCKAKSENLAHILGYQFWAVTLPHRAEKFILISASAAISALAPEHVDRATKASSSSPVMNEQSRRFGVPVQFDVPAPVGSQPGVTTFPPPGFAFVVASGAALDTTWSGVVTAWSPVGNPPTTEVSVSARHNVKSLGAGRD